MNEVFRAGGRNTLTHDANSAIDMCLSSTAILGYQL